MSGNEANATASGGEVTVAPAVERTLFDSLVLRSPHGRVQHSWGWGEVRKTLGWDPHRYSMKLGDGRVLAFTLLTKPLPLGTRRLAVVPAAPPFELTTETIPAFIGALRQVSRPLRVIAVTMVTDTPRTEHPGLAEELGEAGLRPSVLMPRGIKTIWIDLKRDEKHLLQSMSTHHRRYTRKARRSDLTVRLADSERDFERFYEIYRDMTERKGIPFYRWDYFAALWRELGLSGLARLYLVEDQGTILGGTVVACEPRGYLLLYSAHRIGGPNLGASLLLEWEIMMDARGRQLLYYDLGGLDFAASADRDPGDGVTFWKLGFGGEICEYAGLFDLVIEPVFYTGMRLGRAGTFYQHLKRLSKRRWF